MDEVGRGTTVTDGLAIAYATIHHLLTINQCRSLFATHFHELADMLGYPEKPSEGPFSKVDFFCTSSVCKRNSFAAGQSQPVYKNIYMRTINTQPSVVVTACQNPLSYPPRGSSGPPSISPPSRGHQGQERRRHTLPPYQIGPTRPRCARTSSP